MKLLHTMLRCTHLERSLAFYCEALGMKVLRRQNYEAQRFTLVYVGYGEEADTAVIELTHNWDTKAYTIGDGFGHVAIGVSDLYAACERIAALGHEIVRAPGPMKFDARVQIAFIQDPDGYLVELIQG